MHRHKHKRDVGTTTSCPLQGGSTKNQQLIMGGDWFLDMQKFSLDAQYRLASVYMLCRSINPLLKDKISDSNNLKPFADNKIIINLAQNIISVSERIENIVGKRRKCWVPAFSTFPTMFSKAFFLKIIKTWDILTKRLNHISQCIGQII